MPLYNTLSAHYPFVECILLTLPIVDKMYINDGGSTDGTLEVLKRLRTIYHPKIEIVEIPHESGEAWNGMDKAIEQTLRLMDVDWVIEIQADEFVHPDDYEATLKEIERADKGGYNSLRQIRWDIFEWHYVHDYQYKTVRIFRNLPNVVSKWGGDSFHFKGEPEVRQGFTSHNLYPELESDVPIYHIPEAFPITGFVKADRHANHYAIGHPTRTRIWERKKQCWERSGGKLSPYNPPEIHNRVHRIFRGLVGLEEYQVRGVLYSKHFVENVLGLRTVRENGEGGEGDSS